MGRRQTDHGATCIVRDTHDIDLPSAMREELFDRCAQAATRPIATKSTMECSEAGYKYGSVEGAAERTSYKCGPRLTTYEAGGFGQKREACMQPSTQ